MHPITELINSLDKIADEHEEIHDTAVRECLSTEIIALLLNPKNEIQAIDFEMFDQNGNDLILTALERFRIILLSGDYGTFENKDQALQFLQDPKFVSDNGNIYDEYFGYSEIETQKTDKKPFWKLW